MKRKSNTTTKSNEYFSPFAMHQLQSSSNKSNEVKATRYAGLNAPCELHSDFWL